MQIEKIKEGLQVSPHSYFSTENDTIPLGKKMARVTNADSLALIEVSMVESKETSQLDYLKKMIEAGIKRNRVVDNHTAAILDSLVQAQDLAEMQKKATAFLQDRVIDLPEKGKKLCEVITDFDSIEKIKEALLFYALKEIIKSKLQELKCSPIWIDLLMNSHDLDKLKKHANSFPIYISHLPEEVTVVCNIVGGPDSIEEIIDKIKMLPQNSTVLPLIEDGPRRLHTVGFFKLPAQETQAVEYVPQKEIVKRPGH